MIFLPHHCLARHVSLELSKRLESRVGTQAQLGGEYMCRSDSRENAVVIDSLSTVTGTPRPCLNRWRFWTTLKGQSDSVRPPWFDASRDRHIPALKLCLGVSANGAISILAPMSMGSPRLETEESRASGSFWAVRDLGAGHPARGRGAKLSR